MSDAVMYFICLICVVVFIVGILSRFMIKYCNGVNDRPYKTCLYDNLIVC